MKVTDKHSQAFFSLVPGHDAWVAALAELAKQVDPSPGVVIGQTRIAAVRIVYSGRVDPEQIKSIFSLIFH